MLMAKGSRLAVASMLGLFLFPQPTVPQMPAYLEVLLHNRHASSSGLPPAFPSPVHTDSIHLTPEQAQSIGRRIWINESGGTVPGLTHWNRGEDFASLGIAHFIWYPRDGRGPFVESFTAFLSSLESQGVVLPWWLHGRPSCFWGRRKAFYAGFDSSLMRELRGFLEATIEHQARFTARRLEEALPKMLETLPEAERGTVRARFYRVAAHPNGVYALVDYVNFKGEGVSPSERYAGVGWGLLQVLQEMQDTGPGPEALDAFSHAAAAVLARRVHYSPPERRESRWLIGWRKRLSTYRLS
jgi:hypothetical protein